MRVRCLHCKTVLDMRDVPVHAAIVCPKSIALGALPEPMAFPGTMG